LECTLAASKQTHMGDTTERLADLTSITGLGLPEATILLEAAGGDLETAVSLHFQSFEQETNRDQPESSGQAYGGGESEPEPDDDDEPAAAPVAHQPVLTRLGWALSILGSLPGWTFFQRVARGLGIAELASSLLSLTLYPLRALGLLPPGGPTTAVALQRFASEFEAKHGLTHPTFFQGGLSQALHTSRQGVKFVLVYFHSAGHAECASFCREVLSSELFVAFVNENFVFWVADVSTPEGRAIRGQLRVRELPGLAVLAHSAMTATMGGGSQRGAAQALGTMQGSSIISEENVIATLTQLLDRFEAILEGARLERRERDIDRMLREEQEAEYANALAADQAREAEEAAEAARQEAAAQQQQQLEEEREQQALAEAQAEEAKLQARIAKAETLPAEPAANAGGSSVVVRMPDGERLVRRFPKDCALQCVVDWIESCKPDAEDFDLVSNYPRKEFGMEHRTSTLEQLGLHPAATLFTKEQ